MFFSKNEELLEKMEAIRIENHEAAAARLKANEKPFTGMMRREKQRAERAERRRQRELAAEQKKKAEADAAKGQALMQTFIEHINDLVGPEESSLQNDIEPLIAQPGMNRVMEIVARASKKYKEQSIKLKETQNNLKDKELELKFQTLIKQNVVPQQVVEKASKKRPAPVAQNTQKVVTQSAKQAYNPYAFKVQGSSSRIAPRTNMNENLLKAYQANRGAGMGAAKWLYTCSLNSLPVGSVGVSTSIDGVCSVGVVCFSVIADMLFFVACSTTGL